MSGATNRLQGSQDARGVPASRAAPALRAVQVGPDGQAELDARFQ
nr:hypothetical protein [Caulobacter henricii]